MARKLNADGRRWIVAGEDEETAKFILAEVDRNEAEGKYEYTIVIDQGYGDRNPYITVQNGQIISSRHY